jgi:hypothetical protein
LIRSRITSPALGADAIAGFGEESAEAEGALWEYAATADKKKKKRKNDEDLLRLRRIVKFLRLLYCSIKAKRTIQEGSLLLTYSTHPSKIK